MAPLQQTKRQMAQLEAKVKLHHKLAEKQLDETVRGLAGEFVEAVDELTPKDTHRASNGWIDAGRKAGVTDRPLHPLNPSSRREKYLTSLAEEIVHWEKTMAGAQGWMDKYEREDATRHGRRKKNGKLPKRRKSQPFYKKMKRVQRKAEKRRDRVREELAKAEGSEHFIIFDVESIVQRKQGRNFSTVRAEPFGGEGSVETIGIDEVFVTLKNKEPHIRIIEKHPHLGHPVATAKAILRAHGLRTASTKYINDLRVRSRNAG